MEKSVHTTEHRLLITLLREFRERAGVSQIELGERLQETQSVVSKYERGERRLDFVQLRLFCTALGVPVRDFVAEFESRLAQDKPPNDLRGRRRAKRS